MTASTPASVRTRPATTGLLGSVCVLLAATLWGTTGSAAALAPGVGPLAIGAAAMGIGGLLQAVAAGRSLRRHAAGLRARRGVLVLSAVMVAIYPLAFYSSMRLAGVAVGTVVSIGSAPAAAALIERVADGTPLSRRWALGAALGVGGVALLAAGHPGAAGTTASTGPSGGGYALGIALGLVAGLTYATYSWGAGTLMRSGVPTRTAMGAVFGLGGLALLPVLAVTGAPILASAGNLAVTGYLAVAPMCLGYVLFGLGLARVGASTATTLSLVEPAVAAVLATLLLGESLTAAGLLGIGLIVAGLVVTTTSGPPPGDPQPRGPRPRRRPKKSPARPSQRTRSDLKQVQGGLVSRAGHGPRTPPKEPSCRSWSRPPSAPRATTSSPMSTTSSRRSATPPTD